MAERLVKWNRRSCGSAFSVDGRFRINPVSEGGRPVFALIDRRTTGDARSKGRFATHAKAKLEAEELAKREECERIVDFAENLAREKRERESIDPERVEGVLGALDVDERTVVLILYACTGLPIADLSGRYRALGLLNEGSTLSSFGRAVAKRILEDDPEARDPFEETSS